MSARRSPAQCWLPSSSRSSWSLGLRQSRTDRSVQALKRGQKALANTLRDQEIETGLAALNRYATLAGRDLDKTPDAAD